jgi:hypothetical protein
VRGEDKAHGGGAGGEHLLPFRDFHMRAGAAHHGDHEWRAHQTLALGLDMFRRNAAAIASPAERLASPSNTMKR